MEYVDLLTILTYITGPKMRFPICFVFQNVTFPHISYVYLAEDRATFLACRKYKFLSSDIVANQ